MQFEGKRVVVAGCGPAPGMADDLGEACARAFVTEGADVILVQPSLDGQARVTNGLASAPGRLRLMSADPSTPADLSAVAAAIGAEWDRLDVLVTHYLGVFGRGIDDTSFDQWEASLRVTLSSVFVMTKGLLPLLRRSDRGAIVNIGSIDGALANPNVLGYSVAKGGINALTHALAGDLASSGIRVNCVARATSSAVTMNAHDEAAILGATPLARAGDPEEYAAAALFLASPAASYLTGVILPVDGGRTAMTPGTAPGYRPYARRQVPKESR